jgi:hypothetical protein
VLATPLSFVGSAPFPWPLGIRYSYWLEAPSVDRKWTVIGKGVGSASRRGPAELAEAPQGTGGLICVEAGGGEERGGEL